MFVGSIVWQKKVTDETGHILECDKCVVSNCSADVLQ